MRSKIEIQRAWPAWFADRVETYLITGDTRTKLMQSLAQEVSWLIGVVEDVEAHVQHRLDKIQSLLDAHDGTMASFDEFWDHRQAFLIWFQT